MARPHLKTVLLFCSVAEMCRKNLSPTWLAVISEVYLSSDKKDPLTIQTTAPVVALQLKVAVDPSVALTDEGGETNAAVVSTCNLVCINLVHFSIKNACIHFEFEV